MYLLGVLCEHILHEQHNYSIGWHGGSQEQELLRMKKGLVTQFITFDYFLTTSVTMKYRQLIRLVIFTFPTNF